MTAPRARSRRSDGLKPNASPAARLDLTRANARPRLRQAPQIKVATFVETGTNGLSSNRTRLRSRRPKNPGHWKIATRDWGGKTTEKLPNSGFSRSERRYSSRQCPGIAGLSAETAIGLEFRECVAGAGGFEPPYGGIKIQLICFIYQ